MVTFRGRHGYDRKAPLIDGFEVTLGGNVVGFIDPSGTFSVSYPEGDKVECPEALFTPAEMDSISEKCAKVRQMPSEYGWIGVGEPMDPTPKLP